MNKMHESNHTKWNAAAPRWKARRDSKGPWHRGHLVPDRVEKALEYWRENALTEQGVEHIAQHLGSLEGKNAVVLGSGDNFAAFALASMGATVTSVDISERQLEIAAERAKDLGLEITFHQGDISDLPTLPDGGYHFACSVGVVAIWISDLWKYYAEASRLLTPGGLFVVGEVHPVRQMWSNCEYFTGEDAMVGKEGGNTPEADFFYFDRGPHQYLYNPETGAATEFVDPEDEETRDAENVQYIFQWTVSDYLMAMIDAGFEILHVWEEPTQNHDQWRQNCFHALPSGFYMVCKKKQ